MLGKLSSVTEIVEELRRYNVSAELKIQNLLLRRLQIDNYAVTELIQGQTRRWAIAWSFGSARLPDVSQFSSFLPSQ